MKNIIILTSFIILIFACSEKNENTMFVQGQIKNLKKGTLYLQKIKDSLMVTVDSIALDGIDTFNLSDEVESPELYFLSLNKLPSKQISFFGEKGTITINTKLDKFQFAATIHGLTNQNLLDEYHKMKRKFNDKRLQFIKDDFEAKKLGDSIKIDSIRNLIDGLVRRKYYYTTNFAVNHPDNEIAPYLALTELYNANITLLDTINNTLTPKIKASIYGKKLERFISDIKRKE